MKYAKLYMVGVENNHNKYYIMRQVDDDTFQAEFGREGAKPQKRLLKMSRWNAKYREKTKPYNPRTKKGGYRDRTNEAAVETSKDTVNIADPTVATLFRQLQRYSGDSIDKNYADAGTVTQVAIDHAIVILQEISDLASDADVGKINKQLERLYTIVPRKMKSVSDHVAQRNWLPHRVTDWTLKTVFLEEQNIDILSQQVAANIADNVDPDGVDTLESMGLAITPASAAVFDEVANIIEHENRNRLKKVYVVGHKASAKAFQFRLERSRDKTVKQYWHGSQNARWMSILSGGLQVRPVGIRATGYDMFGKGIYFADRWQKSFGYTSAQGAYWASQGQNKGVMALFDVHVGNPLVIRRHDYSCYDLNYDVIQQRGYYDSVSAPRGIDLLNSEYVVYNNDQVTMRYLVEVA